MIGIQRDVERIPSRLPRGGREFAASAGLLRLGAAGFVLLFGFAATSCSMQLVTPYPMTYEAASEPTGPTSSATIGRDGGSVTATDGDGTRITLSIPPGATIVTDEVAVMDVNAVPVSMTPARPPVMEDFEEAFLDGIVVQRFLGGVRMSPSGLHFDPPATLTWELPSGVAADALVAGALLEDWGDLQWRVLGGGTDVLELPVSHFSGAFVFEISPASSGALFDSLQSLFRAGFFDAAPLSATDAAGALTAAGVAPTLHPSWSEPVRNEPGSLFGEARFGQFCVQSLLRLSDSDIVPLSDYGVEFELTRGPGRLAADRSDVPAYEPGGESGVVTVVPDPTGEACVVYSVHDVWDELEAVGEWILAQATVFRGTPRETTVPLALARMNQWSLSIVVEPPDGPILSGEPFVLCARVSAGDDWGLSDVWVSFDPWPQDPAGLSPGGPAATNDEGRACTSYTVSIAGSGEVSVPLRAAFYVPDPEADPYDEDDYSRRWGDGRFFESGGSVGARGYVAVSDAVEVTVETP